MLYIMVVILYIMVIILYIMVIILYIMALQTIRLRIFKARTFALKVLIQLNPSYPGRHVHSNIN